MEPQTLAPPSPVPPTGFPRRPRRRHYLPVAAALLGLVLAAAACSSDPSNPGVARAGTSQTTGASTTNQAASNSSGSRGAAQLAYSQCMRAHGVANFPDPNSQGAISIQGGGSSGNDASNGLDPNNPTFQAADKACRSKLPVPTKAQQAQAMQNALKQARCMRAHGIKDFPDPQSSNGRITMTINGSAGSDLNPNNPLFQQAQKVCMPNAPRPPAGGGPKGSGSGSQISVG